MKSQIQKKKKKKKEWWNCGITNTNIFPKKCFSSGDKNFSMQKHYGEVVLIYRTNDRSCQGLGEVSQMINAFSSRSNI